MLPPSLPVLLEPSPCRPRSALCSGLKRKCTRVLWRSLDSMITSPPLPPSPPDGPPRGTYFSRRKATQPLPPSPAFTRIFASSINKVVTHPIHGIIHVGTGTPPVSAEQNEAHPRRMRCDPALQRCNPPVSALPSVPSPQTPRSLAS